MILITGANGHLGSATIDFLLKKNPEANVKALVRSKEKGKDLLNKGVEIVIGDYLDYESLINATKGVDTVLLISSSTMGDRVSQHLNVIKAAKQNDVRHIVYTSVLKAKPDSKFTAGIVHYKTENDIMESSIDYTFMRNTYYSDYVPGFLGNAIETGTIYFSAGNSKVNFAARNDMAEANAVVLNDIDKHKNKVYEITSKTSYTFNEIAEMISEITGKSIKYVDLPSDTLKENIIKSGAPKELAEMIASIGESIKANEFDYSDNSLEMLIGREPIDLKEYLKTIYSK